MWGDILSGFIAGTAAGIFAPLLHNFITGSRYWRKRRAVKNLDKVNLRHLHSHASDRVNAILNDREHEDYELLSELLEESAKALSAGKWGKRWRNLWFWLRYGW